MRSKKQITWMTAEEYAKFFRVTTETVRRNARDGRDFEKGELKKVGHRWYFRQPEDAYTDAIAHTLGPRLVK